METLSLIVASACLGYAAQEGMRHLWERFRRKRLEVRTRAFLSPERDEPERDGTLTRRWVRAGRYLESGLERILGLKSVSAYRTLLESLIRRSERKARTTPALVASLQILSGTGAFAFFTMMSSSAAMGLVAGILGMMFPLIRLNDEACGRERRLLRELPDALEKFSLCVEAGLTLDQAWSHYLRQTRSGPLADEITRLVGQIRAGSPRREALSALSERLNLTDIALFASSVTHAERAGTGMSATLRRLSVSLRDKQTQRAEKAVQELPVKLLLPLLLCVMPVTLLVVFAPVLLRLLDAR